MDVFLIVGVACGFKKLKRGGGPIFCWGCKQQSRLLRSSNIDRNGLRFAAADQRNRGGEPQVPPPDHSGVDEPHGGGPALQVLGLNRG